jgi:hypothetical protein
MGCLFSLIWKNLKVFWRSKLSAIVTIVAPLFVVLLMGYIFSTSSLQEVRIGVYSEQYSDVSVYIMRDFKEQSFSISLYKSEEECLSSVRQGDSKLCVIFPPDLSEEGNKEPVVFHADKSMINLVDALVNNINSGVSSKSVEIGEDLAQEIIIVLENAQDNLPVQRDLIIENSEDLDDLGNSLGDVSKSLPSTILLREEIEKALVLANKTNETDPVKDDLLRKLNSVISEVDYVEGSLMVLPGELDELENKSGSIIIVYFWLMKELILLF